MIFPRETREIDKIGSEIRQIDAKPAKVGRVAGLMQE
jgi:hypothetical protein